MLILSATITPIATSMRFMSSPHSVIHWHIRYAVRLVGMGIAFAVTSCTGDSSSSAANVQFRSEQLVTTEVWAPVGQATVVSVLAVDAHGYPVADARIALRLANPSVAMLTMLPNTAAQPGVTSATVRGVQLGAVTQLIADVENGPSGMLTVQVPAVGGVYDVTTRMTTFSFETPAPSPPDCPSPTLYCTHVRPFTGASFTGTLTVTRDSVYGNFGGLFCNAWSDIGCTSVLPMPAADYAYYTATKILNGAGPFSIALRVPGSEFNPIAGFSATPDADSLYGTVYWAKYPGRSPPTHRGTFVATLRR